MSILIFLLVLFVLILVHEFGHFVAAKKTGMRVDEFGIGFPPKLFGIKKGETEYTLNALPVGGFVKIYGEDLQETVEDGETPDTSRAFSSKSKWAQSIVLVAGVTMNALFAWFLFSIAFMVGTPQVVSEEDASADAEVRITHILPESPAAEAGIPNGATVLEVQAGEVRMTATKPSGLAAFISEQGEEELLITYAVGEETGEARVTPKAGIIEEEPERAAIGVGFGLVEVVRAPIHMALYEGFTATISGLVAVTVGITNLLADALTFNADLSQVAGPVGIVGLVGEASAIGITTLLMFTAFISLNLAVINLLPFPALDGGRLLFVIIEAIKGSPIRPQLAYGLNAAGFALLILLMIAITWNDIARIV